MALSYEDRRQAALGRLQQLAAARAARNDMLMRKAEERYKQYMAEMRRREEEARKRSEGNWLSGTLGGAFTGALTGLMAGGPMGALTGAGIGAGAGLVGHRAGMTDFLNARVYPAAMMMGGMQGAARMQAGQGLFSSGPALASMPNISPEVAALYGRGPMAYGFNMPRSLGPL